MLNTLTIHEYFDYEWMFNSVDPNFKTNWVQLVLEYHLMFLPCKDSQTLVVTYILQAIQKFDPWMVEISDCSC